MVRHRIKLGGYRRDPVDKNDKKYGAGRFNSKELPPRVDLRPYMTKVEQQGEVNSCTANAMAGAYEYLAKREFGLLTLYIPSLEKKGNCSVLLKFSNLFN